MKRTVLFIVLFLLSAVSYAITRSNLVSYASALNGKKKSELKTAVYNIIKDPSTLTYGGGYKNTWWGFYQTDRIASTNECINRYSSKKFYFETNQYTAISGMNIEHSFPKSWWGGANNSAYKDLFNLYPSDSEANSYKSNYPMDIVTDVDEEKSGEEGYDIIGKSTINGEPNQWCWEPGDQYKGDFSRVYMYMATCYQNLTWSGTQGLQQLENNTWPTLREWAYTLYLQWIKSDPVSELEVTRNDAVYNIQNNRNLFVDYPYLAEYIWGDSVDVAFNPYTSITTASDDNRYYGGSIPATPSISLNQTSATLQVGSSLRLTAYPQNAGTAQVSWSSTDTNIATVSNGVVTGVAVGTTTITASIEVSEITYSASCNVTVTSGGTTIEGDYVKVTSAPVDWSGTYLIVYESSTTAGQILKGSAIANSNNGVSVTISSGTIANNTDVAANEFTIVSKAGGYSIQGKDGNYIGGKSGSNVLNFGSTDSYTNTISYDSSNGCVLITCNTSVLRYNVSSTLFRYYQASSYSNKAAIQLYKKTESTPVTPSITLSEIAVSLTVGETKTLYATTQNANGASVTWLSSNTSVATVSNGIVTSKAVGSATITAKITVNGTNYTATCNVTVTDNSSPEGNGTLESPYSVAEVLALYAENKVPTTYVYVRGIISNIKSLDVSQWTRAQYYISDDGTTTNQFYVYNGLYLNQASFTSNDQIQVGDEVVIYGKLTTYGTTNEFAANNYVVSLVRPSTFLLGDVNKDNDITIADVTALVNIILGKDNGPEPLYNHEATDVNEDGGITIADVTALVNIILGKTN